MKKKVYLRLSSISVSVGFLCLMSCSLKQADAQADAESQVILKAKQGSVIMLPQVFKNSIRDLSYDKVVAEGPQLLMSDDPEYILDTVGIALRESVKPGSVRLYVYNVNGVVSPRKMPRKIMAFIKNMGKGDLHFKMLKSASQVPSTNYYLIGKTGLADYFSSQPSSDVITVAPGENILIDNSMADRIVEYNELAHGIYEFSIDQPAEVEVVQTSPDASPINEILDNVTNVAASINVNAGRGLFPVSNYHITSKSVLSTSDGPIALTLADGKTDPWVKGTESINHKDVELAGNYGVMYDIDLTWESPDGKGLALVTWNPQCDGMANTMVVSDGKFEGGIIQLPSDQLFVGKSPEAILIQVFKPSNNGGRQKIHMTYSPPGASCLPTPLVFVPVSLDSL